MCIMCSCVYKEQRKLCFTFSVNKPPTFILVPQPLVINEGDNIELPCKATGKPVPEISWYNEDEQIEGTDSVMIKDSVDADSFESESRLCFIQAALSDECDMYRVVARNSVGSISHELGLVGKKYYFDQ